MADMLANLAIDVLLRLGAAARSAPSGYGTAAAKLGAALGLPRGEVAAMEGADDFRRAVAEVIARVNCLAPCGNTSCLWGRWRRQRGLMH